MFEILVLGLLEIVIKIIIEISEMVDFDEAYTSLLVLGDIVIVKIYKIMSPPLNAIISIIDVQIVLEFFAIIIVDAQVHIRIENRMFILFFVLCVLDVDEIERIFRRVI